MTFDGREYGALPLLLPPGAHPHGSPVGDIFAGALRGAYMVARTQANLIGVQTYRAWLKNYGAYATEDASFAENDYVDIAPFKNFVPNYATHIVALALFAARSEESVEVFHRVSAFDGTTTATGSGETRIVEPAGDPLSDPTIASLYGRGGADEARATCEVELNTLSLVNGIDLEVTVSAYAETEDKTAAPYEPHSVFAWWTVRG